MGTHCGAEPLTGLELDLSVHVVDIKISIAWERGGGKKEEKDTFQTFVDSKTNHMLTEEMRNERLNFGAVRAGPPRADIKHLKGTGRLFSL